MVSRLGHKSGFALVHHYSTPLFCKGKQYFQFFSRLLQQFLAAVHVARLPLSEQTELMGQKKELSFMWQFYAGLITSEPFETFQVLDKRYCNGVTKALANCAYEANWVCDIPSSIEHHILTAADIHHLKITSDMSFVGCCFGKAAVYQLGKEAHAHALNGDRQIEMEFCRCVLPNDELGSLALPLQKLSLEGCDLTSTGAIALGEALKKSKTLELLDLLNNSIDSSGAASLCDALRVNKTLRELKLGWNRVCDDGASSMAATLKVNNSLKTLSLEWNRIGKDGAGSLGDALRVNHSLKTLNLTHNSIDSSGAASLGDALRVNHTLRELK